MYIRIVGSKVVPVYGNSNGIIYIFLTTLSRLRPIVFDFCAL